ncbi:outer membrane protein TolC [Elusimicrobium posterum]|uniref:TolC family protein n=1 Tax=Elusimicrobium posterum TaxID=3116653 RepID=UPI003C7414D1
MNKKTLLILSLLSLGFNAFGLETQAPPVYNLDYCIQTTLDNNPSLAASKSSLKAASARVWQSGSVFLPQISASGSWNRSRSEVVNDVFSYNSKTSASVSASMTLLSFGKNYYSFKSQQASYDSSEYDFQDTLNTTIYNVTQYYYDLVYAIKSVDVYEDSVSQYEEQLKQAQSFFDVGLRSKYDVINAEVNLNNAKLNLIVAKNKVTTAYATLNNIMGINKSLEGVTEEERRYPLDLDLTFVEYQVSLESAISTALQNRPDLASAMAKSESSNIL